MFNMYYENLKNITLKSFLFYENVQNFNKFDLNLNFFIAFYTKQVFMKYVRK